MADPDLLVIGEIGWMAMMIGWRLTILSKRHIKIEHPSHTDIATLHDVLSNYTTLEARTLVVEYEVPQMVPRNLRTGIQIVFWKILARSVHDEMT